MQTGAVIVAAGACSRMGNFKPMMNVGSISISQRLVATLQQAGVSRIVMVTGYQAEELEHHLAGSGVIFLRNEAYLTTQMFDSAKIGLSYIRGKCDRVFFMPVDVPLFTAKTMEHLLKSGAELACPVCDGMRGHPIMLSDKVIDRILSDSGDCGLQGALSRCGIPEQLVAVADEGILLDVDTPADYHSLVKLHNDQMIRPVVHITLAKQKDFFDERIALLLNLIDETHSVRHACKQMQISYSSGWNILNSIEEETGCRLVERNQGGNRGSRSNLTPRGRLLMETFYRFEDDLRKEADRLYENHYKGVFE